MKQSSLSALNAFSAVLLGLTGLSFLLISSHQQVLLQALPLSITFAIGGLFYLGALVCAMTITIPASQRKIQAARLFSMILLGMLFWLYLKAQLLIEALPPLLAIVLYALYAAKDYFHIPAAKAILRPSVAALNIASALLLSFRNLPQSPLYGHLGNLRGLFIGLFLVTAFLGVLSILKKLKFGYLLTFSLAIPWLLWCYVFIGGRSLPNIIPPAALSMIVLFGGMTPWQRLALPPEDIVGRRAIIVGSLAHVIILGFITGILFVLDQTLQSLDINPASLPIGESAFYIMIAVSGLTIYGLINTIVTINGLANLNSAGAGETETDSELVSWSRRVARYLKPFSLSRDSLQSRVEIQADQITILARQLNMEKKRNAQLTLLAELSQQLEAQLDQPVAAQLAVNTLERAIGCDMVCLFVHETERREFVALASAGRKASLIPPGYRQSIARGVLGRAARQRKTQIVNDTRADADYFPFEKEESLSAIVTPIVFNGHIEGLIGLADDEVNAFTSADVALTEMIAGELGRGWERSNYYERLTNLIEAGVSLASKMDPQAAVQEIAAISRQILGARFTYVKIQPGRDNSYSYSAFSGYAPRLTASLEDEKAGTLFIKTAMNALQPFRVRDARKNSTTSHLNIDHPSLRSLLVIPIRLHRLSIGAILAFGKQDKLFFTENDESLASLLSIQAAGSFEGTWLQQELRASLTTTSLLYQLSNHIIQAEEIKDAALYIAQTAHKLAKGSTTGIVLFTPDGKTEAEVEVGETGAHSGSHHPLEMIQQVMQTGEALYKSSNQDHIQIYLPIQTHLRQYGVLWLNIPEGRGAATSNPADLQTLANQAAIALERSRLLVEWRSQAEELKVAYAELELTYDRTLAALMSSLDARDRETEGHSLRVSQLAVLLGKEFDLTAAQLKALERGSLLHDIGKIGVSDTILHKPGPLNEREWKAMRLHPDIGARIVEGIPFLQDTIPVIRYHQERWDGSGYPLGLSGREIPLLARIFAIVDAFDALTSDRPYRTRITDQEALNYLNEQAGILFDPEIVQTFIRLYENNIFKETDENL
jgi:HD-GYP domain-containing protein (c-di-GMP phosphodiesterase class II)/putative methionine-R-sulfoxide reductase with GAF domain